jgi:hypothetical protein
MRANDQASAAAVQKVGWIDRDGVRACTASQNRCGTAVGLEAAVRRLDFNDAVGLLAQLV